MSTYIIIALLGTIGLFFFVLCVVIDTIQEQQREEDRYIRELVERRKEDDKS
jgi:hypothetical protein